ncbi:MAG: type II toxin-antitoxin system VapC family toxin [Candidatus Jordarchaeaceae archaeon]
MSIITLIEVLRGVKEQKIPEVKKLLEESFMVINLNNKIVQTYCHLYQKLKEKGMLLPDSDLLIAATAIAQNLTLQSRNQHFQRLKPYV